MFSSATNEPAATRSAAPSESPQERDAQQRELNQDAKHVVVDQRLRARPVESRADDIEMPDRAASKQRDGSTL